MDWKTLLAYSTGTVDQELLLRPEYLVTENRILRQQINGRVQWHCQLNGDICQTAGSSGTLSAFRGHFMTLGGMSELYKCPPDSRSGRGFSNHPLS
jgi:hypothetical protein